MNSLGFAQKSPRSSLARRLYAPYKWLVFVPSLGALTFLLGSLIMLLSVMGAPDFASRVFGSLWGRCLTRISLSRVVVEHRARAQPGQSYVVIANHQSQFDILVIYGYLGLDIKWVMKQELRRVPILGAACAAMGHILVDRGNTSAALASINAARDRIRQGLSVVFFPEGTRADSDQMLAFKKGAFRLAIELQLPILPVTILGSRAVLPTNTLDLFPGEMRLVFGEPISTEGLGLDDLPMLQQQSYQVIHDTFNRQAPSN